MDQRAVFRPSSNFVYAGLAWFLLAGLLWADSVNATSERIAANVLLGTGLAYGVYLLFVRPRVVVFDDGIEIRNPVSSHTIGWQDVELIDSKYTMSVRVDGKTIHAWAAPAPGRYHARTVHPTEARHLRAKEGTTIPAGDSPRAHSGVATHIARLRYERFTGPGTITTSHRRNYVHATAPIAMLLASLLV